MGLSPPLVSPPGASIPRRGGRSASPEEPGHCSRPHRGTGSSFSPNAVSGPRRVSNHSSSLRGLFMCICLCWAFAAGASVKASLFSRARAAPASPFLGFSPVSSHRGKKKRSRMFGKICRSVEHFLHWCKRRGGQGGRGGRGRAELRGRAPGHSPLPHVPLRGGRGCCN